MNEQPKRDWAAARRAREAQISDSDLVEQVIDLFMNGALAYRSRSDLEGGKVSTHSTRLKRVRAAMIAGPSGDRAVAS